MVGMYVPSHFAATPSELDSLLRAGGLVDLVSTGPDGLLCTPLPMLYLPSDGGLGVLQGHVARNNPHWSSADPDAESLVIVRGADAYISPNWYATKAEHGRVVPTWNYLAAHVYGRLVPHDDVDWLQALVSRLTDVHESTQPAPWQVSDAPAPFIAGQLRAIVGVELVITRIEAKAKLSQNRSAEDRSGVVSGLGPDSPVAQAMSRD